MLSALISLSLTPLFPPLRTSLLVNVINSGLWNVISESFVLFRAFEQGFRNAFLRVERAHVIVVKGTKKIWISAVETCFGMF